MTESGETQSVTPAPTFSIVMPAYNAALTIEAAIESVLSQTRSDFELIVVDDGSTDETTTRVQQYLGDDRVRLISQANQGQASARNAAIAAARGEFASFLDSDDVWLPRYLEVMAETLAADDTAAVAYTDAWVLDDETRRIARTTVMEHWHPPSVPKEPELFLRALLEFGNFVFVGATIRRATLAEVGPLRVGVEGSEDYELWLRIAARGYRFVRCPLNLAVYRRSSGQMSADQTRMRNAANEVFRIVSEEYEIPGDVRELARSRLPMTRFPSRPPRRVPRLLRRPYRALSRIRHFYLRPPLEIREAFPNLRSL
jgi:glycosyltransferase involved in cell wall biosynthesis